MKKRSPIRLNGNWKEGFALDFHTVYSEYLGEDQWGHTHFDTKRTGLGQLLYELKYRNDKSKVNEIVSLISPFLDNWKIRDKINYIIPAPASKPRTFQPVFEISKGIGYHINRQVLFGVVEKSVSTQAKSLPVDDKSEIEGSIIRKKSFRKKVSLLLVDDLFQTGKTLNEMSKVLNNDMNVEAIYVLTMTKTRR